ncbi:PEP-utilizing enzyme [Desulfonatronovibrio hydrogenovorans]|uniref:PEP-utilizing enzyme n=1 Tax=Desulfonatronovibrio hydrogenovorans TaxID=53245 RepID=UPI00048B685E|nr:PEP-utilizing enzyme [Desulfonatronovibrio hydrogenovorans]
MKTPQCTTSIKFGSKADTLSQLQGTSLSPKIPSFLYFSLQEWQQDAHVLLQKAARRFDVGAVAVRSSAVCEDGGSNSHAGAFMSVLDVDPANEQRFREAVKAVFASYPEKNPDDQVLVQKMVTDIDVSGVIMTRCVDDGSPYYVLNYDESGRSDGVTSGSGIHKTVLVYRDYRPEYCDSERVRGMLDLAREVEALCGSIPLDIEFALDKRGLMHLLQVRRISTAGGWHPDTEHRVKRIIPYTERFVSQLTAPRYGLFGTYTIFGNMPDWNPAELIGVIPSPLAASLFRWLISSHAWSHARARMGYRRLPRTELMVLLGGRTFIDVRASFNSFLPQKVPAEIGEKLVNAWLDRLAYNPSLHDKVEFEVAHTVLDFSFDENFNQRYTDVLNSDEKKAFKELLCTFTNKALDISDKGSLPRALKNVDDLASLQTSEYLSFVSQSPVALAGYTQNLLEDCLQYGTIPFTIIARHGFIAETLLRSAVSRGALTQERLTMFKSSFRTVMGDLASDTKAVCQGKMPERDFQNKYGHLRPGTFDIMSPCYKDRQDLFDNCQIDSAVHSPEPFELTHDEQNNINSLLQEAGINTVDAQGLFAYSMKAIQGREYGKFIFTRNLSAALEAIAVWGGGYGLGREDLSHLTIQDIIDTCHSSTRGETTTLLMHKVDQARIEQSLARVFKLSYLVRGVRDIHVVPIHRSEPNYISNKQVERPPVFLKAATTNYGTLNDYIVCIENADPGFDWIFTKGIAGLITKYGGANSHMAIRCAELQLPAAIGCGEEMFERLRRARKISLDCGSKTIRSI